MDHYAVYLDDAVRQMSSMCQQSNAQISQFFDDLDGQHSNYIPYTINRYYNNLYEQPFTKSNIVAECTYDSDHSLFFDEKRKYMLQYMNNYLSEISKDIIKFIHDNPSGAYNAEISRYFGFSKYNYDNLGHKYNNLDYISHNILSMMTNRANLKTLTKRENKTFYQVISSKEFEPINIYDVKRRFPSKYEAKIANMLEQDGIMFIPQYRFTECRDKKSLPFDFYLPEYDVLMEIQGQQHYEPIKFFGGEKEYLTRIRHDNIKCSFAKHNNLKLILIKYDEVSKIKNIRTHINTYIKYY